MSEFVSVFFSVSGIQNKPSKHDYETIMNKSNLNFIFIWTVCVTIYGASLMIAQEKPFTKEKKSGYETISELNSLIDSVFVDAKAVASVAIRELQRCKMRESLYVEKATLDSLMIEELKREQEHPLVSLRTFAIAGVSITVYSLIQLIFGR